jgi:hypothetical protein
VGLRRFLVDVRSKIPLLVVDAYWDQEGRALCPAAEGLSHHIGPRGDLEFCPPIQLAVENIRDKTPLPELFRRSTFLSNFRTLAANQSRGCILMESPQKLAALAGASGVRDTSGRNSMANEFRAGTCLPSHHQPGREIPERHWLYRIIKKQGFFGFGAYG